MCFVARGFLDAYIDLRGKIRPTDVAAGYLIAKEAGAKIYSDDGSNLESDLDVKTRFSYVAVANEKIREATDKSVCIIRYRRIYASFPLSDKNHSYL